MTTQNQLAEIQVSEIMSSHVQKLMADDTVQEAVALMVDHSLNSIPIVDSEDRCIGMLSRTDLTELFLQEDQELARVLDTDRLSMDWIHRALETSDVAQVKELMTYEVSKIQATQNLHEASREMVRGKIHHLPVVDENEKLVGILSSFDIVKAVANAG
jgi:CBS-domain-containing membrane protein